MNHDSKEKVVSTKTYYVGDAGQFSDRYRRAELGRLYLVEKVKDLEERIKSLESSLWDAKDRAIAAEEKIRKIEEALHE